MKSIQIRNVPDDVHRVLRHAGCCGWVSLSDCAIQELERVAEHPPVADVLARAQSRAGGAHAQAVVATVRSGATIPDAAGRRRLGRAAGDRRA